MIENLLTFDSENEIYRFAYPRDALSAVRALGLDADAIEETLRFLAIGVASGDLTSLLDGPFEDKSQLRQVTDIGSRYSDGTWPVFYAALEVETSQAEVLHHFVRRLLANLSAGRTAYYMCFRCRYTGTTKDLRPKLPEWPDLIGEDYEFCQGIGREAQAIGLAGLLTPSARRSSGTAVPVFRRTALADPAMVAHAAFTLDATSGTIAVTLRPME